MALPKLLPPPAPCVDVPSLTCIYTSGLAPAVTALTASYNWLPLIASVEVEEITPAATFLICLLLLLDPIDKILPLLPEFPANEFD